MTDSTPSTPSKLMSQSQLKGKQQYSRTIIPTNIKREIDEFKVNDALNRAFKEKRNDYTDYIPKDKQSPR